jgi:transporter family protein
MTWLPWALLSALFAGLTAILAKVGVKDVDSNLATAIRTSVILVFAWTIALVTNQQTFWSIAPRAWMFLMLSGLATGASWLCYFKALQMGNASQVAPIDKLSIVVVMVLAAAFLGESLSWTHWLGGTLIATGAVILALAR